MRKSPKVVPITEAKRTHTKEIAAKVEALLKIAHESEAEANV